MRVSSSLRISAASDNAASPLVDGHYRQDSAVGDQEADLGRTRKLHGYVQHCLLSTPSTTMVVLNTARLWSPALLSKKIRRTKPLRGMKWFASIKSVSTDFLLSRIPCGMNPNTRTMLHALQNEGEIPACRQRSSVISLNHGALLATGNRRLGRTPGSSSRPPRAMPNSGMCSGRFTIGEPQTLQNPRVKAGAKDLVVTLFGKTNQLP